MRGCDPKNWCRILQWRIICYCKHKQLINAIIRIEYQIYFHFHISLASFENSSPNQNNSSRMADCPVLPWDVPVLRFENESAPFVTAHDLVIVTLQRQLSRFYDLFLKQIATESVVSRCTIVLNFELKFI